MVQQQSQVTTALAGKTETENVQVRCPSCGDLNALDHCTTLVLPKAHAFPAGCVVLAAVECQHCGCVSFFNPRIARLSQPPSDRQGAPTELARRGRS